MSNLNLSYEIDNGTGEIAYFKGKPLKIKEPIKLANIIANEIVNEILDNALNIVTRSTSQKNPELNQGIYIESVGDILEQISTRITKPTDEMISPYDVVNYDAITKGGVGDANDEKLECTESEIELEIETARIVEKKSRLTDLIKNSPQIITEYLMIDEKTKHDRDEWEEAEEKLVQIIDLEHVELSDIPDTCSSPTNDFEDEEEVEEVARVPSDNIMDIIDLTSRVFKEEGISLLSSRGAKGDQSKNIVDESVPTNVEGNLVGALTEKQSDQIIPDDNNQETKLKKKKWNFGTKIWGFLKKSNKQGASHSTKHE